MKSFAFILNPINTTQLKRFWPVTRILPDFMAKFSLKNLQSPKVLHIKKILSLRKQIIKGCIIVCPLLPGQSTELGERDFAEKILSAVHAAERLDVDIIGLESHAAMVLEDGKKFTKDIKIPVTSGSTFTAWSVFEAIYRVAKAKNINLKKSTLAVINAVSSVGSLCARKLSDYVRSITIFSSQKQDKLGLLKEVILHLNPIEVTIEEDARRAVKGADVVINVNDSEEAVFGIEELKPNSIVCDVSLTNDTLDKASERPDIAVIAGGLIKLPESNRLGIDLGLPEGIIYASMAETMLLTFEGRFENYSEGNNINLDRLEEVADMAVRHGFEIWVPEAPLM